MYRLHHQGDKNRRARNNVSRLLQSKHTDIVIVRSVLQLLVTAYVVPSSPILVSLMMETILASEKSVLTRATGRNIAEDGILQRLINSYL
jgi:hypothetical protein